MENPGFDPGASRLQSAHSSDWANPPKIYLRDSFFYKTNGKKHQVIVKKKMTDVGFEPTPPKRLVPKTSALDHSANQSYTRHYGYLHKYGGLAQSVECVVRNDEAAGSKPAFSILSNSVLEKKIFFSGVTWE